MSDASHEADKSSLPLSHRSTLVSGPDHQKLPVAQRLQLLAKTGMVTALTASKATVSKQVVSVADGSRIKDQEAWIVCDEKGRPTAALQPLELSRYLVHSLDSSGFRGVGVEVEAVNGKLGLFDRSSGTYQFIGRAPAGLAGRTVSTDALSGNVEKGMWQEMTVPNLGLITWNTSDRMNAHSGAFASGWKGYYRSANRDVEVFVKIVRSESAVRAIARSDGYLKTAGKRNAAVKEFAPSSGAIWTHGAKLLEGADVESGSAVIIERLVTGPTLDQLSYGEAKLGREKIAFTHPRQFAAAGELTARALADLNVNAPDGQRLAAPDATKPDNLMCTGFRRNAQGEYVPIALVCPDRDHYQLEAAPSQMLRGTFFYSDMRGMAAMTSMADFAKVDQVHSFQVGRMLLGVSLGSDLPRAPTVPGVAPGRDQAQVWMENMNAASREFTDGLKLFDARFGTTPGTAGGELGRLIRDCCAFDEDARPSLKVVEERAARIALMKC